AEPAPAAAEQAPRAVLDAAEESPEAAMVHEDVLEEESRFSAAAADGEPTQEAVDELLTEAQPEAKQNEVQVIPTETDETEVVLDAHPAAQGAGAARPANGGAPDDTELLKAFMTMDGDGDLLLTRTELASWQGWPAGR